MKDKFSISEVSKFSNISKQTLRYYDKIGLYQPAIRDEHTGYRYYEYTQLFTINLIEQLKKLRLSLAQIKSQCKIKNLTSLEISLLEQQQIIHHELNQLNQIKLHNDALIAKIEQSKAIRSHISCHIDTQPTRYMYAINIYFSMADLYSTIKLLYSSYIKNIDNEPVYQRGDIVLGMDMVNLQKRVFNTYGTIGFFVSNADCISADHLTPISAGIYAITHHVGAYSTIHNSYKRLYRHIQQEEYEIIGSSLEFSIINISTTNNQNEFLTELQIPVRKIKKISSL